VEGTAIAGIRVPTSEVAVGRLVGAAVQNRVRRCDREHGVFGKAASWVEERKVGRLRPAVFVDGADDVTRNHANHATSHPRSALFGALSRVSAPPRRRKAMAGRRT